MAGTKEKSITVHPSFEVCKSSIFIMKTLVALSALLAVAVAYPLPLVQVIVNVESNQGPIVDDRPINVKPEPTLPELPEEPEVLPAPAELPEPVFPVFPQPEQPEVAPEESEVSASEESEVSASEESQESASEEQEAVAPVEPEVVVPAEPEFVGEEELLLPQN